MLAPNYAYFQSLRMSFLGTKSFGFKLLRVFMLMIFIPFEYLAAQVKNSEVTFQEKIDLFFGEYIVSPLAGVLFWPIPGINIPLVVAWLLGGAIFSLSGSGL